MGYYFIKIEILFDNLWFNYVFGWVYLDVKLKQTKLKQTGELGDGGFCC